MQSSQPVSVFLRPVEGKYYCTKRKSFLDQLVRTSRAWSQLSVISQESKHQSD
jgi:hypothetical protein